MTNRGRGRRSGAHSRFDWASLALVTPFVLVLAVLIVLPVGLTVRNAFYSVQFIGRPAHYVGLAEFRSVLRDPVFWLSLKRSGLWVVGNAVLQTLVAFTFALVINARLRGTIFAQIMILLPWIIPTVAAAVIGTWLMNSSYGVVNYLLVKSHLVARAINAFGNPKIALWSLVALNSWHWFPFFFVVVLGALQTVPTELFEAAAIDGASSSQRFFQITLPLVSRILGIVGLVGTLWGFNVLDAIYLITKGGPAKSTYTAPIYVYETAFNQFQMGKSSAASVVLLIILALFAVGFYNALVRPAYQSR